METKFLLPLIFAVVLIGQCVTADINCYSCDSSTDPNCINNVAAATKISCPACMTKNDNGKITRGCSADPCDGDNCKKCDGELCNTNTICTKCDTSDPSCLDIASNETKYNQICDAANTKCFVNIKEDKTLERRCSTSNDKCENKDTCDLCDGANCNNKVFPSDRRRCYQCSDCGKVLNIENVKPKVCPLFVSKDECYVTGTDATKMTRGCKSDKDNKCSGDSCYTCSTDNCNYLEYEVPQSFRCVQCASNQNDTSCHWSSSESKDCKNIKYYQKGACYTKIKDDVIERGCLFDKFANVSECKSEDGCTTCDSGNGCNNKAANFTCIRCRSDEDTKCWKEADKIPITGCRLDVTEDKAKCFHGIWNNVLIRGCLVDADPRQQVICNDEKNHQCKVCKGVNCNADKVSGAASMVVATGLIALLLLGVSSM